MVVKEFGQPAEVKDNNNETIYVYKVNQDIQLMDLIKRKLPLLLMMAQIKPSPRKSLIF